MESTFYPHSIHPINRLPVLSQRSIQKQGSDPSPTEGGKGTSAGYVRKIHGLNVPSAKVGYAIPAQSLQETVLISMSTQK